MLRKIIDSIRKVLPDSSREMFENVTILSYLCAFSYGYLMIPRFDGTAIIYGEDTKFFVHPDISAVDCLREIWKGDVYEKYRRPRKGDLVIDVGANVGMFTVKVGKEIGNMGRVISIEPSPQNLELLRRNIDFHNLKNRVIVVPRAVSSFSGKSKLLLTPISGQCRLARSEEKNIVSRTLVLDKAIEVEVQSLDEILKEFEVEKVDLLKIDVEGAELEVLKGAKKSLSMTRHIAMELHNNAEKIVGLLREKGFIVQVSGGMLYARIS